MIQSSPWGSQIAVKKKYCLTSFKNIFPMLILTFSLNEELNNITLHNLFLLVLYRGFSNCYDASSLLSDRAFSYNSLPLLNSSWLQGSSDNLLFIILGSSFMIVYGWIDLTFIHKGLLLTFLKGRYFSVNRVNVTSKKSISMRFISILIERPLYHIYVHIKYIL